MAQSKATKKFEKKHLKDTLKRRKDFAKVKQRHHLKEKKRSKKAEENGVAATEGAAADESRPAKKQKQEKDQLNDMSVDEFFAGGFEIPSKGANGRAKTSTPGKRKRIETKEEEGADSSSDQSLADPAMVGDAVSNVSEPEEEDELDPTVTHKDDLKALESKDPEFYKYLKENDAELLDFAEDDDLAEIDELSGSDNDAVAKSEQRRSAKTAEEEEEIYETSRPNNISESIVKKWTTSMANQRSLRAMREIVLAFRAAAHLNEDDGKEYKYTISDATVYHEVLIGALRYVPEVISHHLPTKELKDGTMRVATDSKKFRNLTALLKSHTMSLQHLLQNLADAATIRLTLSSALEILPYILTFKKVVRELTRAVVEIWSDSAQDEATRIGAFLILRQLVVIGDDHIRQSVLRTAYQGLVKGGRATTIHNLNSINLMKNSAAELWGLAADNTAYTTAFTFVRQLAIHLRNSIKNNSNDSYKAVYNWQYVHSLDFWSRVLSRHCDTLQEATKGKESVLRPLIYPLTQVTLGAMRLIPTAAYFPLRFHLVRSLIRLSRTTNTFIPLATPLYEVLSSGEMKKPPKLSTLKPVEFDTSIRVAKSYLRTRVYQDGVGEQVVELLSEFFNLWCKNIAFPELALPVVVMLKRWMKEVSPFVGSRPAMTNGQSSDRHGKSKSKAPDMSGGNRNSKVNGMFSLLLQKLDANSKFIEERRAKVDFAPNDRASVEAFLKELEWSKTPLGAFVEGQRKQREERKRIMEEGRKEEEEKRRKQKAQKERQREEDDRSGESSPEDDDDDDDDDDGSGREGEWENEDELELEDEGASEEGFLDEDDD